MGREWHLVLQAAFDPYCKSGECAVGRNPSGQFWTPDENTGGGSTSTTRDWLVFVNLLVNLLRCRYNVTRAGEAAAIRVTCFALGGGANIARSMHHDETRVELP